MVHACVGRLLLGGMSQHTEILVGRQKVATRHDFSSEFSTRFHSEPCTDLRSFLHVFIAVLSCC